MQAFRLALQDQIANRRVEDQRVIERAPGRIPRESETRSRVGLGIAIDNEGAQALRRERCAQINGRSCLPYSAFSIGDGDHTPHVFAPPPKFWKIYQRNTFFASRKVMFHVKQ